MRRLLEKWGQTALAALCVGAILFAALYTRQEDLRLAASRSAAASQDETLGDAQEVSLWWPPVAGAALEGFPTARRTEGGLWAFSPWVRCAAASGQSVCAMAAGTVLEAAGDMVRILHMDQIEIRYRSLQTPRVHSGDAVAAGQVIGSSSGAGIELCALQDGQYLDVRTLLE